MNDGDQEPCYYCGKPCDAFAGNPGKWPIPLCHRDAPGFVKFHHIECVTDRLIENNPPSWPPMRPMSEESENPSDEVLVLIFGLWSVMPYCQARAHRGAIGWYPLPPLSPAKLEPTT